MSCAELQNRRVQVRFLSHLAEIPEFMGIAGHMAPAQCACVDPYPTPMPYHQKQHRRSMSAALLVMDFVV